MHFHRFHNPQAVTLKRQPNRARQRNAVQPIDQRRKLNEQNQANIQQPFGTRLGGAVEHQRQNGAAHHIHPTQQQKQGITTKNDVVRIGKPKAKNQPRRQGSYSPPKK